MPIYLLYPYVGLYPLSLYCFSNSIEIFCFFLSLFVSIIYSSLFFPVRNYSIFGASIIFRLYHYWMRQLGKGQPGFKTHKMICRVTRCVCRSCQTVWLGCNFVNYCENHAPWKMKGNAAVQFEFLCLLLISKGCQIESWGTHFTK